MYPATAPHTSSIASADSWAEVSTPRPSRVMVERRSNSSRRPPSMSATSRRVEFVPMSMTATLTGCGSYGRRVSARLGPGRPRNRLVEASQPLIFLAEEFHESVPQGNGIQRLGEEHRLDVRPVLGSIENRLEQSQLRGTQDRDPDALEGHLTAVARGLVVDRQVAEEQVDRGAVPPQTCLAVPLDCRDVIVGVRDPIRQSGKDPLAVLLCREHVDIDVVGAARILDPVGECDRPAKRVFHTTLGEARVDRKQLIGEVHRSPRSERSGGQRRVGENRTGRRSAKSITLPSTWPRRSSCLAFGSTTGVAGAVVSRAPAAASRRASVPAEGTFAPDSYADSVACDVPPRCASSDWVRPASRRAIRSMVPISISVSISK